MYKERSDFKNPPSNAILWRYMDFTKFVSLLEKQALYFASADKLGDPFEGSFSKVNEALRPVLYEGKIREDSLLGWVQFTKESRRFTLINCWHENAHESEAMWRLYAREKDGIAIKTDFDSFKNSFACSEEIYIGRVNYVDYSSHFIPESSVFFPYLHKRKSFEHEHEVRAISWRHPFKPEDSEVPKKLRDNRIDGVYYKVDISLLIQEIIIAPFAPDWFLELVKSVTTRYNFNFKVVRSTLADEPAWG